MKPRFALNLSHEGISLLHKSPHGTWTEVGDVALDDPDLGENLSFLRSTAVGLEGKGFGSRLIVPNSQILYREVYAPGPDDTARRAQILEALEGQTPYDPADLTFDWTGEGQTVLVAIVANETLDEAEEFAVEHRFNPLSFVGRLDDTPTSWEPYFGRTDYSYAFLGEDAEIRDTPMPPPPPTADDSLFADGAGSDQSADKPPDAPADRVAAGPDQNFFAATPEDPGPNIFAGDADAPVVDTLKPVAIIAPDSEAELAPSDTIPAFTSRRHDSEDASAFEGARPIERLAPRIAISPADGNPPSGLSAPTRNLITQDQLRAGILGDEDDAPTASPLMARFGLIWQGLLAFVRRLKLPSGMVAKLKSTSAILPWLAAFAGRIKAKITALIGDVRAKIGSRDKAAPDPIEATPDPAAIDAPMAENVALLDAGADADGLDIPTEDTPAPDRRRQLVAAIAVVLVVGLAGLGYLFFAPGYPDGRLGDDGLALDATSPARGVRADNPARERPSDFDSIIARSTPGQDAEIIPPIRPERRSLFENASDPDADLPDTAESAENLTAAEIAAIRAAGIDVPTPDEIADDGEPETTQLEDDTEALALYRETGILQALRNLTNPNLDEERDDIYVAGVDRNLEAHDATILPDFNAGVQDDQPRARLSPLAADLVFDLDANGLVKPSTEGTLNPEGILIFAGKPTLSPPPKPETEQLVPPDPLAALQPKARPETLKTGAEAIFIQGRLTLVELRDRRAKHRPESEKAAEETSAPTPTELAVLTSYQPAHRPSDFDKTVAKTRDQLASTTPATAPIVDTGPVLPTRASVAKQATIKNAINLGTINLIGVSGTPNARRALLRLSSGRFVRVKIGDRVDGGKVAAIGIDSLSYVKSGRNRVLKVPE